jgi:two-component SAPR family response regulator
VRELEVHPLKGHLEFELNSLRILLAIATGEIRMAKEHVESAIALATRTQRGTRLGYALGLKGLVSLLEGDTDSALEDLSASESWLLDKGEVPLMSEIYVEFGTRLGGSRGEAVLLKGLELLRRMNADAAIEDLVDKLKVKGGFKQVVQVAEQGLEVSSSSRIEIRTFGGLSLLKSDTTQEVTTGDWSYAKSRELLALLIMKRVPAGYTRQFLAAQLWPESDEKKAQASLRVALTHLRKVLGEDAILQDGQYLGLDWNLVRTDLQDFLHLSEEWRRFLRDGKNHAAEDRALKAMEIYSGDFLPEFYSLPVEDQQFMLRSIMKEILIWMAETCMDRAEYRDAVRFANRLIVMEPFSETASRIVMRCLHADGDGAGAIEHYERLRKRLAFEYGTIPGPETTALYEKIARDK